MRTALLFILLYTPQSFANATGVSRVYECQNQKGFARRLEVQYPSAGASLPCRVVFFRGDVEAYKIEHVLMEARHESGKCEAQEEAYLAKMKSWNVPCQLVIPKPAEEAETVQTPPPPPAPPGPWAGYYAGVTLGAQFGQSGTRTGSFGYNADNERWNYHESGLIGGLALGYNYLWNNLVIGPEIELGYMGLAGSGAQPSAPGSDTNGKSDSDFYSMIRARAGADLHGTLLFLTAGAIGVHYETRLVDNCNVAPCGGSTVDAGKKGFAWGSTVGAGLEHLYESGWSVKLEYLYFSLGSQNFSGTTNIGNPYDWSGQTSGHIIRGGLNRQF